MRLEDSGEWSLLMNFDKMIEHCKRGGRATRWSWFRCNDAVRYINSGAAPATLSHDPRASSFDYTPYYVGHFPQCIMSGDASYENSATDSDRMADDWVYINTADLEKWQRAFEAFCGGILENEDEDASISEPSLISAAIDNGLFRNHISDSFDIDKELK